MPTVTLRSRMVVIIGRLGVGVCVVGEGGLAPDVLRRVEQHVIEVLVTCQLHAILLLLLQVQLLGVPSQLAQALTAHGVMVLPALILLVLLVLLIVIVVDLLVHQVVALALAAVP